MSCSRDGLLVQGLDLDLESSMPSRSVEVLDCSSVELYRHEACHASVSQFIPVLGLHLLHNRESSLTGKTEQGMRYDALCSI